MKNKIIRRLDILWLRITNLFRDEPIGYIEKVGTIEIAPNGGISIKGWHVNGLGKATGIDLSEQTLFLGGVNTGVILKKKRI